LTARIHERRRNRDPAADRSWQSKGDERGLLL